FKQGFKVFFELVDLERSTTNRGMNNTGTISAVLNLTCLCIFYCSSNIRGHSTHAWVGHQTTGTQNLSQRTHNTPSIWGCSHHVKIYPSLSTLACQSIHANNICTSFACLVGLVVLGKNSHADILASSLGENDRTANHLVRFACIYTQLNRNINGLIEFRSCSFLN